MEYKGHTQGNIVILAKPLPVPDGTEVAIVVAKTERSKRKREKKTTSVTQETFGSIPADPRLVRQVLQEDLYET